MDKERFFSKTKRDPKTGCLEWTGALDSDGYGVYWLDGGTSRAHRVAWEIEHGPLTDGTVLLHTCDNPKCVNVNHLSIGSQSDNLTDMKEKERAAAGEDNAASKLIEDDIPRIRRLAAAGFSDTRIGREFGVKPKAIKDVRTGKTWGHIE